MHENKIVKKACNLFHPTSAITLFRMQLIINFNFKINFNCYVNSTKILVFSTEMYKSIYRRIFLDA